MSHVYVSLDLETTGLDPESDDIIEVGAVRFGNGQTTEEFQSLIKPDRPIPYRVQRLCGIRQEEVDEAPGFDGLAQSLLDFIGDSPLVGHNVQFDIGFLERKYGKLPNPSYDTYELATLMLHHQPDYSLASLADSLGLPKPQHRALADAVAAKELFLALLEAASELPVSTLEDVILLARKGGWDIEGLLMDVLRGKAAGTFGKPERKVPRPRRRTTSALGDTTALAGTGHPEAIPLNVIEPSALLEPDGPLATTLPDYEHRPGQIAMAREVGQVLDEGGNLIVEAGTGTGKSIAYLLPSIVFALRNGSPVVISTNTINLQGQLISKDIPHTLDSLKTVDSQAADSLRVVQLKGRSNYLCRRRFRALHDSESLTVDEARLLARVAIWLESTNTGDRAELNLTFADLPVWNRICATYDESIEGQCPHRSKESCFLHSARRAAENAHLIVVNHALLLSDLAAGADVLPPYSHVIIDEAHHLEDEATSQLGFRVNQWDIREHLGRFRRQTAGKRSAGLLAAIGEALRSPGLGSSRKRQIRQTVESLRGEVDASGEDADELFEQLRLFVESNSTDRTDYERSLRITWETRKQSGWSHVETAWGSLRTRLSGTADALDDLLVTLQDIEGVKPQLREALAVEIPSQLGRTDELIRQMDNAITQPDSGSVYWITVNRHTGAVGVHSAPLEVRGFLENALFSANGSVVLTGATLTSEGSFHYIKDRLGAEGARTVMIDSPFDYLSSTLVYLPNDIPDPQHPAYQRAVESALIDICRETRGRTLVLFTSHASLRQTQAAIRNPLEEEGVLVLGQGIDGSPRQLLAAFKGNPNTVLLGTASFWEGIDVVGDALAVLVITRLPFNVPTEPTFEARSELLDDPFNQYAVPQATIRFKQGFGRLIRSHRDRGIVVVMDRRVQSKRYGSAFLESIPTCTVRRGSSRELPAAIKGWLGM